MSDGIKARPLPMKKHPKYDKPDTPDKRQTQIGYGHPSPAEQQAGIKKR